MNSITETNIIESTKKIKYIILVTILFIFCIITNAQVTKEDVTKRTIIKKDTLIKIEANPILGYNFPYFIFIPSNVNNDSKTNLIWHSQILLFIKKIKLYSTSTLL